MREFSTYQATLQMRRVGAWLKAWREGWRQGFAEGAIAEARKILRFQGDDAFGAPGARTAAAIERIDDLARLEEMLVRLPAARSWQDLLGSRRPRRRAE